MDILQTLFWVVFTITILFLLFSSFERVPESKIKIVERLGKYNRILRPGMNLIIPFVESITHPNITTYDKDPRDPEEGKMEMRNLVHRGEIPTYEIILDPPNIDAISKDNAMVFPDALLYFRIVDPVKAVYEIEDLGLAIYKLLETTLRQEIGILDADQIIVGREAIGSAVKTSLEEASAAWGTTITRVEIEEIRFDAEVTKALSDQRAAELTGRARVATAERDKEAQIITAEADKRKIVLNAEAQFEREKLEAEAQYLKASRQLEGQAKGTEALALALEKNPNAIVALKALESQIEVAEAIGKSQNTLIIPEETVGLFGAIKSVQKILEINLVDEK